MLSALVVFLSYQNCGEMKALNSIQSQSSSGELTNNIEKFKCDPSAGPTPSSARRLTKTEMIRSYDRLLSVFSLSEAQNIKQKLAPWFNTIPEDLGLKFDSDDSGLSQSHVNAYLELATAFSGEIAKSSTLIKKFMGSCANTTQLTQACLENYLKTSATKIMRRPLKQEEIEGFVTRYSSFTENHNKWFIAQLLMNSNFLFHLELEGAPLTSDTLRLSPYEVASRLSFYLLKSAPDDKLLAAAGNGQLDNDEGLRLEIERLKQDYPELIQSTVADFYAGWLGYENIAHPITPMNPEEVAFANGAKLQRQSLINELKTMTSYYTLETDGSFADLFLSSHSFAVDQDLSTLYGVQAYQPGGALVPFGDGRAGLLGRAAFLISGSTHTSPIIRGLMVRNQFLCEELPPPPDNIGNMVREPEPDQQLSTRERFDRKTSSPACYSCHQSINPLGFALESFDAFGRIRDMEIIFDSDGRQVNQIPIDPVVQPNIHLGDSMTSSSPSEFNQLIVDSGKAQKCMAQSFFQYTYRQSPDISKDGCSLAYMDELIGSPEGLRLVFFQTPLDANFRLRKVD